MSNARGLTALIASFLLASALAAFCPQSPAFPVPTWSDRSADELRQTLGEVEQRLKTIVAQDEYNTSSYSVAVTTNTDGLWSAFHTALDRNQSRIGTQEVNGDSQYRIASITKVFTVLGILKQQAAGNLSLDEPINKYVLDLPPKGAGGIPWKDITLRILASQLSGIPREFAQSDLINHLPDPTEIGLPPPSSHNLPKCDEYNHYVPCNNTDMLETLDKQAPLFAPNFKSTYSNVAFNLLGLAIENVTGMDYSSYIQHTIFDELDMTSSSLETPSDKHAVIPKGNHYWDVNEGVQRPTGGIYTSSDDMSKFARYILTHHNALATGVNWLQPGSWASGLNTFYGMPFEIFRTDKILTEPYAKRPVTFATKGGGLPGYYSDLEILPDYGLGLSILVAGSHSLLEDIREALTIALVHAAERLVWQKVQETHAGHYQAVDSSLNSSITLAVSPSKGLYATSFISNGTDVLGDAVPKYFFPDRKSSTQLVPTLLYKDEKKQAGEIFRLLVLPEPKPDEERNVWDDFCITDVDQLIYDGKPLNEVVFWHDEDMVELPVWQFKAKRSRDSATMLGDAQEVLKLNLEL